MPNFGDLGDSLRYAREVLGPRVTEPMVLHALPRGERREFLSLATRLSFRLDLLDELVEDVAADALADLPFGTLLDEIELLGFRLQRNELPSVWTTQLRDVLRATTQVVRPSLGFAPPPRAEAAPPPAPHPSGWAEKAIHAPGGFEVGFDGFQAEHGGASAPESPAPADGSPPTRRAPRYANAALLEPEGRQRLDRDEPIRPGKRFRLRLDIGALSRESQVDAPQAFPEHVLPDEDVWIDVMVSSTHFGVAESGGVPARFLAAHGRFMLPRDGGPAKASDGRRSLFFDLRAPPRARRGARARVGYYFRGAIVQSQVLEADVGRGEGEFRITTDFTVAESPADLGAIRDRPRISIFTNSDASGDHQVSVRTVGQAGVPAGKGFELDENAVGTLVEKIRKLLRSEAVAPTTRKRRRAQLIADLRALAPLGWELWTAVPAQFMDELGALDTDPENRVLQVARSNSSKFTFPWSFIYEHSLDSGIAPEKLPVCAVVDRWDGQAPLFAGAPRRCPEEEKGVDHRNLLCPFGFWGYRHSLEQVSSSDKPVTAIAMTAAPQVVVGETRFNVEGLADHVTSLRTVLQGAFPGLALREGADKATLETLLGNDLPLVYFFCHGERTRPGDPDTHLGVGKREQITASDFIGWLKEWRKAGKQVWNEVRPLVFINACHSLEINPTTLISYLQAFVGLAHAAGVIGTEVKVQQALAMEFALAFFQRFTQPGCSVDHALHEGRMDFLRDGNLFGLLYTPYCWADLTLRPA